MNIKEINRQNQRGRIHAKAFPGVKSAQLNQYVRPTLEEYMMWPSYMLALMVS